MRAFLVVGALLLVFALTFGDSMNNSLMTRANDFCQTEFNGDHGERVMFFAKNVRDGNVVDFRTDAVDIVDDYKVLSINIVGESASVIVEYNLIAKIDEVLYHGWPEGPQNPSIKLSLADKFVMVNNPKFVQKLLWKYNRADREWYLVSAQLPKVSRNALLKLLKAEVQLETDTLYKNPARSLPHLEAARVWYLKKIAVLESLSK
jgi:hypothetical protein